MIAETSASIVRRDKENVELPKMSSAVTCVESTEVYTMFSLILNRELKLKVVDLSPLVILVTVQVNKEL